MEGLTGVTHGAESFWQVVKGDGKELIEVGYNSANEPISVKVLSDVLFNEWSNGTGIAMTDELRAQLDIKTKYLYVSEHHVIDPTTVKVIFDLFIHKDAHPEIKFRSITFDRK